MAGHDSEQARRHRRHGAEDALRVPGLACRSRRACRSASRSIPGCQCTREKLPCCSKPPVPHPSSGPTIISSQYPASSPAIQIDLPPDAGVQKDQRRNEIADRNALQHARDPDGGGVVMQPGCRTRRGRASRRSEQLKEFRKKPSAKIITERRSAWQQQLLAALPLLEPPRRRKRDGHAHNPNEEREDQVGERPPMPLRVVQRLIDGVPVARDCSPASSPQSSPRGTHRATSAALAAY